MRPAGLVLACVLGAGCTTLSVGRLEMATTRAVPSAALERPAALAERVRARSCVWVLGVVPLGPLPNLSMALAQALDDRGAMALWDVEVEYEIRYVPPLGRACYVIEGDLP